ncbi:hypothetical protein [Methanocalculus sp.]|uniref:hypothetical protein n=1 Tax=Methanocalculus sp. TaxID=2004547 RepID=UPI00261BF3F9|nr:hypothetical protein [Methanocalculus sp.]MDG6250306.1 hypothetical protein [Methanocalculus sp.]
MSQIKEEILRELNDLPPGTCHEVLGFIRFLKSRSQRNIQETVTVRESTLIQDWLLPEEDEAWSGL